MVQTVAYYVQCGCLPGPLSDTSNCWQFDCGIRSRGILDSLLHLYVYYAWIVALVYETRNRDGRSTKFLVSN